MPITERHNKGITGSVQYLDTDGYSTGKSDFIFESSSLTLIAPNISNGKVVMGQSNIRGLDFSEILTDNNATSKAYVDNYVSGIRWKQPVDLVSVYDITTLWPPGGNNPSLNILDNTPLIGGERVLIMYQQNKKQNGIYTVNNITGWIRTLDLDEGSSAKSVAVFVNGGNTQKYFSFVCNDPNPIVGDQYGSSGNELNWVKFSKGEFLKAGDGLTKTSEYLYVNVDNQTIETSLNILRLKDFGVVNSKLADRSVTTSKLADGAITSKKISEGSIYGDKLLNGSITNQKLQNSTLNFISSSGILTPGISSLGNTVDLSVDHTVLRTHGNQSCSGVQYITNQTNSISPETGSVVVSGGIGVGGDITTQGIIKTFTGVNIGDSTVMTIGRLSGIVTVIENTDAVNKLYVDNYISGIKWKTPCKLASVSNVIASGVQNIDGSVTMSGDVVLLKDQHDQKTNGIYIANSDGIWFRHPDMESGNVHNFATFIEKGTSNASSSFVVSNSPYIIGTDIIIFTLFSKNMDISPGSNSGLSKTGTELFVNVDDYSVKINDSGKLSVGTIISQNVSSGCIRNVHILDGTIDSSKLYGNIPVSKLENSSITLNTGYGLLGGNTLELGKSLELSVDSNLFIQKNLGEANIFIGDSSNTPQQRTIYGDIYLESTGRATLENGSVTNSKITIGTISNDKLVNPVINFIGSSGITVSEPTVLLGNTLTIGLDSSVITDSGGVIHGNLILDGINTGLNSDTLTISNGGLWVKENIFLGKDITIGNDVFVGNNITLNGDITIGKDISVGNNITLNGDITIGKDVSVGNNITLNGDITIGKDVLVGNNISVNGNSNIDGNLSLDGDANIIGNIYIEKDINCLGSIKTSKCIHLEDPSPSSLFKTIVQSNDLTGDWVFTLPSNGGNDGDILVTDGTGKTKWEKLSKGWKYRTVYSDTVADYTDDIIGVMTSGDTNQITVLLPVINGKNKITIVDEGGYSDIGNIAIIASESNTILGNPSIIISDKYNSYSLYCREGSTNWFVC